MEGIWKSEWTNYIKGLAHGGISLNDEHDSLLWMHNKVNGEVTTSLAYDLIVSSNFPKSTNRTHSQLWSYDIPRKHKCFNWLCLENHIKTWDNLSKKCWFGPNICCLCNANEESMNHIFV